MVVKVRVALLSILIVTLAPMGIANAKSPSKNPIVVEFIDDMAKKHKFDKLELKVMFEQVEILPEVIKKITRPAESWPWYRYRNLFMKQDRIDQGVEFWNENAKQLARAEKKFGVPAQIIVAIIGVETKYGRLTGTYRLLDSLTTLVVDYPRRSKFFKKELEHVLLLAREEKIDPLTVHGSYAGAMGKPQFMPSSYRAYAIDFNGDGHRDLWNNTADAIGSVASYLKKHGWKANQPIAGVAKVEGESYKRFLKKGIKPKVKLNEIGKYNVSTDLDESSMLKAALIELEQKNGKEYWLGLRNFYAITRYNHSKLYAMAVYQLAESVKEKKLRQNISMRP